MDVARDKLSSWLRSVGRFALLLVLVAGIEALIWRGQPPPRIAEFLMIAIAVSVFLVWEGWLQPSGRGWLHIAALVSVVTIGLMALAALL